MVTEPETKTPTLLLAILMSSLVACKMLKKDKEEELPAVPSASAAAASAPAIEQPKPAEEKATELKLGDVKRFKDKEKEVEGVVKVLEADLKVYNEPDTKTPHVAELNKNIFVSRLATLDDFVLVEFPSGVGELSPGWVEAKFLSDADSRVTQEKVKAQTKAATLVASKEGDTEKKDEPAKTDEKDEPAKTDEKKDEPVKTDEKKDEPAKTEPEPEPEREKPRRKF